LLNLVYIGTCQVNVKYIVGKALKLISKQDFESIVSNRDRLKALGIISDKGRNIKL